MAPMTGGMVALDFDGVCHKYTREWEGIAEIADGPTDGLEEWLHSTVRRCRVALFSSRFAEPQGREAVAAWWTKHRLPKVEYWTRKPPSIVAIDDRALLFTGNWDDFPVDKLLRFRPWNRLDKMGKWGLPVE